MNSIPGLGKSPGGRNVNLLQYSCLENCMDRGVWQAIVHGVTKSWTQLSTHTHTHMHTNTHTHTDTHTHTQACRCPFSSSPFLPRQLYLSLVQEHLTGDFSSTPTRLQQVMMCYFPYTIQFSLEFLYVTPITLCNGYLCACLIVFPFKS